MGKKPAEKKEASQGQACNKLITISYTLLKLINRYLIISDEMKSCVKTNHQPCLPTDLSLTS